VSLSASAERILVGNVLFIVCCAFYVAWWVLRFRPDNPVTGMKSGWLLVPAAVAGLAGVMCIIWGAASAGGGARLFPGWAAVVGWIVAYAVLAVGTSQLFDRPVTSELLLITGWGALALAEVNALAGTALFSRPVTWVFVAVIAVVVVVSLVCYVLYFRLDSWRSYVDGMAPLILTALVMAGISICMAVYSRR